MNKYKFYLFIPVFFFLGNVFANPGISLIEELEGENWFDNQLGYEDVILPGFTGINYNDRELLLGQERQYLNKSGLLFDTLRHNPSNLEVDMGLYYSDELVNFDNIEVLKATTTKFEYIAGATIYQDIKIQVHATVEYDGLAYFNVKVTPILNNKKKYKELSFKSSHQSNNASSLLLFKEKTIRKRKKQILFNTPYEDEFINIVGFPNGQSSYWWFSENAENWIWHDKKVTSIKSDNNKINLKQRIIQDGSLKNGVIKFNFGILVTPVKGLVPFSSPSRIARNITVEEGFYSSSHIWWTTAFSHHDYPYLEKLSKNTKGLPDEDIQTYPGVMKNKDLLQKWRSKNIERYPYFSAHVLSPLDPMIKKYEEIWKAIPEWRTKKKSDLPYRAKLAKTWLSHDAKGYSDYLLFRLNDIRQKLGIKGFYFDQGGILDSKNIYHNTWIDSDGKKRGSIEILAMRSFLKRLNTMLYLSGVEKPRIFIHNSMVPVLPAYTFAYSMVQGEEDIHYLKNYDYTSSYQLEVVRAKYAEHQYGIRSHWLSELWNHKVEDDSKPINYPLDEWMLTEKYKHAKDGFFMMALLHGSSFWSKAPVNYRNKLYRVFDSIKMNEGSFHGYWEAPCIDPVDNVFHVSFYKDEKDHNYLYVVGNLTEKKLSLSRSEFQDYVDCLNPGKKINNRLKVLFPENKKFRESVSVDSKSYIIIRDKK